MAQPEELLEQHRGGDRAQEPLAVYAVGQLGPIREIPVRRKL